eukprot:NODE_88_length_21789_cov_0.534440.p3 type:complete len:478 gc:universal NODE_88_length_21789_cov_0.534440:21546-20113(-)
MLLFNLLNCLRIIFFNDLHGHYENIPGLVRLIKQYRTNDTLLLNGADEFTGTAMFRYYGTNKSVEILNELKFDAMTLGNHEFDRGIAELIKYIKLLQIPVTSSNINYNPISDIVKPYVIKGDIGIIGSTTPDTKIQSPIDGLDFFPVVESAQKYVEELNKQGIYKIILLSHNGFNDDKDIARKTSGISIIVGAHSHSLLSNNQTYSDDKIEGVFPTVVSNLHKKSVYIVQAKCFGKYLGYFDVKFDNDTVANFFGDTVRIDSENVDPEWKIKVDNWEKPVNELYNKSISKSSRNFENDCIRKFCDAGKLLASTLLKYYQQRRSDRSVPTFGLIQSGAFRFPIDSGIVTRTNIYNSLPFDDKISSAIMIGSKILESVNGSITGIRNGEKVTSFLQSSVHSKIVFVNNVFTQLLIFHRGKWLPIKPDHYYRVVTSSFLLSGGDNLFDKISTFDQGLEFVNEAVIKVFMTVNDIAQLITE